MKEIQLAIPKDILRSLLEGKQVNYPYTIQGDGEPLRIVLFVQQAPGIPPKFRRRV